jgi:hypothetical protein
VVRCDGKLTMVCCKVCNEIEGQEKLLVPKFDSLQKHVNRHKCKVARPKCVVGQYFMSTANQHAKNECLWVSNGWSTLADLVCARGVIVDKKHKFI